MNTDVAAAAIRLAFQDRRSLALQWVPVVLGLSVLYLPTFVDLAGTLWQTDDHAHGPIILALIGWMMWQARAGLVENSQRPSLLSGYAVLLCGLLMYALGRSQEILLFEVGSLAPVIAGTVLIVRGSGALRALWLPLLFVIFLIPLPGFVVDAVTGPLKHLVSACAEKLLFHFGYPIARNGVVLTVGSYQLLVADACSGLNSIFSLSALGLFYLSITRYKSYLQNGLLLLSIIPIAIAANIVPVIVLVLVTYHFGDAAGQGVAHNFAGMALFFVALLLLLTFDFCLNGVKRLRRLAGRST